MKSLKELKNGKENKNLDGVGNHSDSQLRELANNYTAQGWDQYQIADKLEELTREDYSALLAWVQLEYLQLDEWGGKSKPYSSYYGKAVPEGWAGAGENVWMKMGVVVVKNGDDTYTINKVNGEKYSDAPDESSAFAIAEALLIEPATVAAVESKLAETIASPVVSQVEVPSSTASWRQKVRREPAPFKTPPSNYSKRSIEMETKKPDFEMPYLVRFGNESAMQKAVLTDVLGSQYRQRMWDQTAAFMKYLRWGERELDRNDQALLKTQIYPVDGIMKMIKSGFDVGAIKANMVESQGVLGGYAVPPQIQSEILMRLPGLTVVRGNGARVVTLTNTNSTEIIEYTGGDSRYAGNIRGQWGNETQTPGAQNATLGMLTIEANVYTYKVGMSQSLVEDAANLVDIVQTDVANVLAIDEDDAFLVGDGIGKPKGILPGGANGLGLTEQNSLAPAALTANGVKKLKRAVQSQYRANAGFIANSDTYGLVETLVDGTGQYLFDDLTETDRLLQKPALESEAMPDVGAGTFPIIFGDLSGYWIVERLGLTIVRFQDSNTGINKVEYHVRRRVGGRVAEPWKFAVQKVSA